MSRFILWTTAVLLASLAPLYSQQPPDWRDPSPHRVQFVNVAKDIRLEVLEWGRTGRALVLLVGGGDTAHVFDDFAPRLARHYHVYAITRPGFGASGYSPSESGADRLGDDVLRVLDVLELKRPALVGHSIAGEEMSSLATRHPDRVAGLVYLEAAYPYAYDDGTGPAMKDFLNISGPQPPPPADSDLASFQALQDYYQRVLGFTYPEAGLRQQWDSTPGGRVGKHRDFPGYATILEGMKNYAVIPGPVLAIFANPHGQGTWVDSSTDPKVRAAANAYSHALKSLIEKQMKAFAKGVPAARVVVVPGAHHYVYLSKEADVLREMRTFLGGLP